MLWVILLLPSLLWGGRSSVIEKRAPLPYRGYGLQAVSKEKEPLKKNPPVQPREIQPRVACTPTVTLVPGVPYFGDTTGQTNKFDTTDYPGLGWDELGPDVVHQITISKTCDLRIYLEPDPVTYPDLDIILLDATGSCDTANWIYAGDYAIIYPDCPPGTYYIIVDGYTASDYGRYTLTAAEASGLLLVDDDGSGDTNQCTNGCPDVQSYYTDALNNMTSPPPTTIWDYAQLGPPDVGTVNNAKYIIWFCGASYGSGDTITATDEDLLKDYLNLGGRLILIGQDILYDVQGGADGRLPDGSLFNDYLQVNEVYQDVWTYTKGNFTVDGVVGNPLSDLLNCNDAAYYFDQFTSSNGAPFNPFVDSLVTRYGDPVYYNNYISGNTASQKPVAIRYTASLGISDYFKTLFLAFAPECDDPANVLVDMTQLFEDSLAWLDQDDEVLCPLDSNLNQVLDVTGYFDDSTTGNNNGIPEPGETFNMIIRVTNNDTVAHSIKVYEGFEDYYITRYSPLCGDLGSISAGSFAEATFQLRLITATPVGYRVRPEYNIIDYTSGTETFCFRQGFGVFAGQPEVLLVKDEIDYPNTTGVDIYETILQTLGYTYALWDTALFASPTYNTLGLSNDRMMNYNFVLWFTGFDFRYTLTPDPWDQALGIDPETEIAAYMDNRYTDTGDYARFFLSSQDFLWDKYNGQDTSIPTTDFAFTHLKVARVYQDYVKDREQMVEGPDGVYPSEKMSMNLQNDIAAGAIFPNYADRIDINGDEAYTQAIWRYPSIVLILDAGVGNVDKSRASRFVFLPFAFENLQDGTPGGFPSKQRFMERLLCQMQMGPGDAVPPCGYYDPQTIAGIGTLYGEPTGGGNGYYWWNGVSFTNTNGEPISGFYRVRRGCCDTLTSGPGDLAVWTTTQNPFVDDDALPTSCASKAYCYNLLDYQDIFGQTGNLNP